MNLTDSEVADRGNSQQAITLDLPGQKGPHELQLLLNAWHEQAHTHALTGDATLLILALRATISKKVASFATIAS